MKIIPIEGLNALAWTMTVADIFLTAGRFVIRHKKKQRVQADDMLNVAALALLLVFIITYQLYVPIEYNAQLYSMGLSDKAPSKYDIIKDMHFSIANILAFWATIYLVKASFLALYWQIFSVSKKFRLVWFFTAGFTLLSFIATWLGVFLRCGKAKNFMNLEVCAKRPRSLILGILSMWCALNVIGDLLLMVLPLMMLRSLQMKKSQKMGLIVVFGLVLIDIAFDLVRTVYTASLDLSQFPDRNAVWALLEPTIAVMVCALPCYRGLITRKKSPATTYADSYGSEKATSKSKFSGSHSLKSVPTLVDSERKTSNASWADSHH